MEYGTWITSSNLWSDRHEMNAERILEEFCGLSEIKICEKLRWQESAWESGSASVTWKVLVVKSKSFSLWFCIFTVECHCVGTFRKVPRHDVAMVQFFKCSLTCHTLLLPDMKQIWLVATMHSCYFCFQIIVFKDNVLICTDQENIHYFFTSVIQFFGNRCTGDTLASEQIRMSFTFWHLQGTVAFRQT